MPCLYFIFLFLLHPFLQSALFQQFVLKGSEYKLRPESKSGDSENVSRLFYRERGSGHKWTSLTLDMMDPILGMILLLKS